QLYAEITRRSNIDPQFRLRPAMASVFERIRSIFGRAPDGPGARTDTAAGDAAAQARLERRGRTRQDAREGTRVLIIDDSPTIVAALRKMLQSAGYLTLEAFDAEAGVELARAEQPHIIFLDIILPGMNGFAALR